MVDLGPAASAPSARFDGKPVLVVKEQDNWLAAWSRADAAVAHPIDPIVLGEAVARLLRPRVPATS